MSTIIAFYVQLLLLILASGNIPTLQASVFPIAKPNCTDHCGTINIPYPFGTNENCYHDFHFLLTCNETFYPPRLFAGATTGELINITPELTNVSLDGQVTMLAPIGEACYSDGTLISSNLTYDVIHLELDKFTVNKTANKLTVLGCDTQGWISGERSTLGYYQTGCSTWCGRREDLQVGSCEGLGCCQSSIPGNVSIVNLTLTSFNNYSRVSDFNCSYLFLAEENAFTFHPDNLTNIQGQRLPLVIDWAIDNVTCEIAMNLSSYACISPDSHCYDPDNGYGYRCQCDHGFRGNPYLDNGCKDVDECRESAHSCSATEDCHNIPGDFRCTCKKGYHRDRTSSRSCIRRESVSYKLATGISLVIILLLLVACMVYFEFHRRRSIKMKNKLYIQNGGFLLEEKLSKGESSSRRAKIYRSSELEKATNNFHSSMIIGKGGFGIVYKGILEDNTIIAVKKSKQIDPSQIDQFVNEIHVLCQINHRNVVELLGCCLETPAPLLVYEFVSNGTLNEHLHDERKRSSLDWNMRLKIATETANVLSYLHSTTSTPIIHRDVKSTNILLNNNYEAKVSDFGGSKLVPLDQTQLSTMVLGTIGYLDPEYLRSNQLTEKSDVYSFGVVLVELLTGKRVLCYERSDEDKNLANYFLRMMKQRRILDVIDKNLVREENREKLLEFAMLAQACLNIKGEDRPTMKEVAMELEGMNPSIRHSWPQSEVSMEEKKPFLGYDLTGFDGYSVTGYANLNNESALLSISRGR